MTQLDLLDGLMKNRLTPTPRLERDIFSGAYWGLRKGQKEPQHNRDVDMGCDIILKGGDFGIAQVWDREVLIYLHTLFIQVYERTGEYPRALEFKMHDMLTFLERPTTGAAYLEAEGSFKRLAHGSITTIFDEIKDMSGTAFNMRSGTSWIESYQIILAKTARGVEAGYVRVVLSELVYNSFSQIENAAYVSKDLIRVSGGVEKQLFAVIARHFHPTFAVRCFPIDELQQRVGSSSSKKNWLAALRKIVNRDPFPDWMLELSDTRPPEMAGNIAPYEGRGKILYLNVRRKGEELARLKRGLKAMGDHITAEEKDKSEKQERATMLRQQTKRLV